MTVSNPKDSNGLEIEPGDLVVSHDIIGWVTAINGWGSINVRYQFERDLRAYEMGADNVPYEHKPYSWDSTTRSYVYGEPETRYRHDLRVVGKKTIERTQVRVNTQDITILRKRDGSIPQRIADALAVHELVFPGRANASNVE